MSIKISPETAALFAVVPKNKIASLGPEMVGKYEAWQAATQAAKELAEKMENFLRDFESVAKNYFDGDEQAAKYIANHFGVVTAKTAKSSDTLGDSWAGKLPLPEKIDEIVKRIGKVVTVDQAESDECLGRKAAAIVALESAYKYERDLFRGQLGEIYSRLGLPSKPVESIGNRAVELRRKYATEEREEAETTKQCLAESAKPL